MHTSGRFNLRVLSPSLCSHICRRTRTFFIQNSTKDSGLGSRAELRTGQEGGSKGQKSRGGSHNVSGSVVEDRGQHKLSGEDQRQSCSKACCTKLLQRQPKSKLASQHSSANKRRFVQHLLRSTTHQLEHSCIADKTPLVSLLYLQKSEEQPRHPLYYQAFVITK